MKAYHLTTATLRDGRPIPAVGETLRHEGAVVICKSGLHASERLLDALRYAPSGATTIHVVECGKAVESHDDKFVCRERVIKSSHPFDLRRVVRLAIECASLASWLAGRCDERLIEAAELVDRGEFEAARKLCYAAASAAARAASAAAANAAEAAADAYAAASAACAAAAAAEAADARIQCEFRARQLLTEGR